MAYVLICTREYSEFSKTFYALNISRKKKINNLESLFFVGVSVSSGLRGEKRERKSEQKGEDFSRGVGHGRMKG